MYPYVTLMIRVIIFGITQTTIKSQIIEVSLNSHKRNKRAKGIKKLKNVGEAVAEMLLRCVDGAKRTPGLAWIKLVQNSENRGNYRRPRFRNEMNKDTEYDDDDERAIRRFI